MFAELNACKYLFLQEMQEFKIHRLRLVLAEGGVDADAPAVSAADMPNPKLQVLLKGSKPITLSSNSTRYQIVFNSYISYAATNIVFLVTDDGQSDGKKAGIHTDSAFLRYVEEATYATHEHPGPFTHYCFFCFDQKIDVVSTTPPTVEKISG